LNKKNMILSLLLVFLFTGLSLGQDANDTSITETILANESIPVNETSASIAAEVETGPGFNFIWSFAGIEPDPITVVLNQDGSDLYGQAKYEPEGAKPWNADVIGSVKDNSVELTMTAQKDRELVTTKMTGTYANDIISGNFTQISGGKKVGNGTFNAMWISPDTSSYTPAVIEEPVPAAQQTVSTTPVAAIPNSIEITESSFQPNPMTIEVGTTVTWINRGSTEQEVAASNAAFDSGKIAPGGQYQYTFSKAGTFDYYSKTTSSMTGKIIVKDNRFRDVRQDADKVLTGVGDISGVPIGMGGAGL
jgi:plastocyanin